MSLLLELTDNEAAAVSVLLNEAVFDIHDQMWFAEQAGEFEEYALLDHEQNLLTRIDDSIEVHLMGADA